MRRTCEVWCGDEQCGEPAVEYGEARPGSFLPPEEVVEGQNEILWMCAHHWDWWSKEYWFSSVRKL